ncbi:MAG TPA: hypothetical protein VMZ50_06915 [Phycisphaerae bacterium]|nr:hypothetical protein [Phycisphaerae bacterium]HUX16884.1 hypothetical protein [Phycisphaerae bacterium]
MTAQPRLFDVAGIAVPHRRGSEPSADGAAAAAPHAGRQALRLLRALQYGDATREELCRATGIPERAACGRLREMECPDRYAPALLGADPLVGKVGRRPAASGVRVHVYRITPAGRAALAACPITRRPRR